MGGSPCSMGRPREPASATSQCEALMLTLVPCAAFLCVADAAYGRIMPTAFLDKLAENFASEIENKMQQQPLLAEGQLNSAWRWVQSSAGLLAAPMRPPLHARMGGQPPDLPPRCPPQQAHQVPCGASHGSPRAVLKAHGGADQGGRCQGEEASADEPSKEEKGQGEPRQETAGPSRWPATWAGGCHPSYCSSCCSAFGFDDCRSK